MKNDNFTTDIQLINVAGKGDIHNMADFPYGMALITSYLREQGFKVLMLQYPTWKKEEYLDEIVSNSAYLYGFQVSSENYVDISDLVKIIKKSNNAAKIVFGGPFVVSLYEELLKNDSDLDAVVLGEGEYTIAELLKSLRKGGVNWKLIQGIAFKNCRDEITINSHRPPIRDLNAMPFAARDGIKDEAYDSEFKYMNDVRITTSRGCTSNCTFCAVNINSKWQGAKRWRGRSTDNVVDEIQYLVEKYNVKLINLQDSAFDDPGISGRKRTRMFCEEILKRGLEISVKAYLRAHSIKDDHDSAELYKLYKEAGIDVVIVGAEAGSDDELRVYGKTANLDDNYRSFRVLNELDLFFNHVGFIMFGPYSTLYTLRQNIDFLWKNKLFFWYHNIDSTLILTPGAAIYDSVKNEGRMHEKKEFWKFPDYGFNSPIILKLAKHYTYLRKIYPHLDIGSPLVITASNIVSRLKNKMNKKVLIACEKEIEEFKDIFYKKKNELNELGYYGTRENLARVEKDGLRADLVSASEPFFGENWASAIYEIQESYLKLINSIQSNGFGLGGLVFNAEFTARESRTDTLDGMKFEAKTT